MDPRFSVVGTLLLACLWLSVGVSAGATFEAGKASFELRIGDFRVPYRVFGWYAMPNTALKLAADRDFSVAGSGLESRGGSRELEVALPAEPGYYPITVSTDEGSIDLNLFVLRPAAEMRNGRLGDYRIGQYPRTAFKGLAVYAPPKGFIEVQAEHRDVRLSPHFVVGQFLSKQRSGWPKYLLVRPELVVKLERVLERLNAIGIRASTLTVMSGYRTPWYNRAIGNRTTSSRHLYGGAADIFIDESPRDGQMDDLNGDGKITKADADLLYDLLEEWSTERWYRRFSGGLASYGVTAAHGPFVHVDARGYRARWGR